MSAILGAICASLFLIRVISPSAAITNRFEREHHPLIYSHPPTLRSGARGTSGCSKHWKGMKGAWWAWTGHQMAGGWSRRRTIGPLRCGRTARSFEEATKNKAIKQNHRDSRGTHRSQGVVFFLSCKYLATISTTNRLPTKGVYSRNPYLPFAQRAVPYTLHHFFPQVGWQSNNVSYGTTF